MEFEKVMEIARFLGRDSDAMKIQKLRELAGGGKLYITFWGHYSAGKSKLINNLLKQDILPVQTRETTAVLTYIQYGLKEYGVIFYSDGTAEECEIGKIKRIFQNSSDTGDTVETIDHVEVFLSHEMLKNGLVIVDTPGINTVIQKHQDLAVEAIEQSGKMVYVLGGPVSNVDRRFISRIAGCGIDILFARTKCDYFHEDEENWEDALNMEKREIEEIIGGPAEFFPVSNEKSSEWYDKIEALRILLMELSFLSAEEMKKSCHLRVMKYCTEYGEMLQERVKELRADASGKEVEVEAKISECHKKTEILEKIADSRGTEIADKLEKIKKNAKTDLENLVIRNTEEFADEMEDIIPSADASEMVKCLCDKYLEESVEQIRKLLTSYFDHMISEEQELVAEFMPDSGCIQEPPAYTEVEQSNSLVIDQYREKLQAVRSELENTIRERQLYAAAREREESDFDEEVYRQAIEELNRQLSSIPGGMSLKVSEDQPLQPSEVLRKVGEATDIALLLLPGAAIAKGVKVIADSTKIAQTLHKMGKVGEVILSAGKVASQNATAIDRVRDLAFTVNSAFGKRAYSSKEEKERAKRLIEKTADTVGNVYEAYKAEKKNGNLLDALSVAYWTEKVGAHFDTPPCMEVDVEEEESRRRLRREITAEQNRIMEERIQKKKAFGLLETKEKELEAREREKMELGGRIEAEIRKKEDEIKKKAGAEALMRYKKAYREYFEKSIRTMTEQISNRYFTEAHQNITMYAASKNAEILDAVSQEKAQLEKLLDVKRQGKEAVMRETEQCEHYMNDLKGMAFL